MSKRVKVGDRVRVLPNSVAPRLVGQEGVVAAVYATETPLVVVDVEGRVVVLLVDMVEPVS